MMKSGYQSKLNLLDKSVNKCLTSHRIWNTLQGLPGRLDFLRCELLIAYNSGVIAVNQPDVVKRKQETLLFLQRLQQTLQRLIKFLDVDFVCQDENVLSAVCSLLLHCICKVKEDLLVPFGLLVLTVAIYSTEDGQSSVGIDLLEKLLEKIENFKEQSQTMQYSILCNGNKYSLQLLPYPETDNSDEVISLSGLVHVLLSYLCLGRGDLEMCMSHLKKVGNTVSVTEADPHLIYIRAFVHFKNSQMSETRILLENWKKTADHSGSCSPQLWNMCGCLFAKQNKPNTAILMYKEALKLDFDFVLAMYNIAQQYKILGLYDAELEILNLLLTTLEQQSSTSKEMTNAHSTRAVLVTNTNTVICDSKASLTLSVEQALYLMCKRCLELKRYDVAGEKYMSLLALLTDLSRTSHVPQSYITLPPVSHIFLECAQSLLYSQQYRQCIIICDRLIERCPFTFTQNQTNIVECDRETENQDLSGEMCSRGKKRLHSEDIDARESESNETSISIVAGLCKVDALLRLGQGEEAHQCLNRIIEVLEIQHVESSDDTHADNTKPAIKKAKLNTGNTSAKCTTSQQMNRSEMLAEAYSKKSIVLLGLQQKEQSLIYSRKALMTSENNTRYMYNHTLVVLAVGRHNEAYTAWLNHRGISTPLDPLHGETILKRKRASLECSKSDAVFVDDELLLSGLDDKQLLNLDVLSLSHLVKSRH